MARSISLARCATIAAVLAIFGFAEDARSQYRTDQLSATVSIEERYTDNALLQPQAIAVSSWTTDLVGQASVDLRSGVNQFRSDFRLTKSVFEGIDSRSQSRRFLDSVLHSVWWDDRIVLDARGAIVRQAVSPFSASLPRLSENISDTQVETRTWTMAPAIRGLIGGILPFQLRSAAVQSDSSDDSVAKSRSYESEAIVRSFPNAGRLSWLALLSDRQMENRRIGKRSDQEVRVGATSRFTDEMSLSAYGGFEQADVTGISMRTNTFGIGATWQPSERTAIGGSLGRRYFGSEYLVSLAHRHNQFGLRISASRNVAFLGSQADTGGSNVFSTILSDLLSGSTPNVGERTSIATRRVEELGLSNTIGSAGALSLDLPLLSQRADFSLLLMGPRNNVALSVGVRKQSSITQAIGAIPIDDGVYQRSASTTFSRRMTPAITGSYLFNYLSSVGNGINPQYVYQRQHNIEIRNALGRSTTATIGFRRIQVVGNTANSFRENSVFARLGVVF